MISFDGHLIVDWALENQESFLIEVRALLVVDNEGDQSKGSIEEALSLGKSQMHHLATPFFSVIFLLLWRDWLCQLWTLPMMTSLPLCWSSWFEETFISLFFHRLCLWLLEVFSVSNSVNLDFHASRWKETRSLLYLLFSLNHMYCAIDDWKRASAAFARNSIKLYLIRCWGSNCFACSDCEYSHFWNDWWT